MQILKDEIREKILEIALEEFYSFGFDKTSIRSIADKTGISVGNVYRYFKSKEEIFDTLLTPVLVELVGLLNHNENEIEISVGSLMNFMENQAVKITEVIAKRKKEIIIIVDGSKGTKYENSKEEFIKSLENHIGEHLVLWGFKYPRELARVKAVAVVEGYMEIIRKYFYNEGGDVILKDYFSLIFFGFTITNYK